MLGSDQGDPCGRMQCNSQRETFFFAKDEHLNSRPLALAHRSCRGRVESTARQWIHSIVVGSLPPAPVRVPAPTPADVSRAGALCRRQCRPTPAGDAGGEHNWQLTAARAFYIIKNSPQDKRGPRAQAQPVRMIVRHCRASARKQSFPAGRHAFRSRCTSVPSRRKQRSWPGLPVRSAARAVLAGTRRVVEALAVRALELGVAHLVAKIRVGRSAHRRAARAAVCPDLPTAVLALGAGRRRRRLCLAGRAECRQQLPDSTTDQDPPRCATKTNERKHSGRGLAAARTCNRSATSTTKSPVTSAGSSPDCP